MKRLNVFLLSTILIITFCSSVHSDKIQGLSNILEIDTTMPRKPRYPADLVVENIHLVELSGNQTLDAYESGSIEFVLKNQGRGEAINVSAQIVALTDITHLSHPAKIDIGNIAPQTSQTVKIPLKAGEDISSLTVKFRVEVTERWGFDADPFTFTFETKAFVPPKLQIADIGIDDDKEGDSYGNNNGRIELGESIEVSVAIQNVGEGDADDVKATIQIQDEGKDIYYGSDSSPFQLGEIRSGDFKTVKFFFSTSRRYLQTELLISIQATESKGKYGFSRSLGLRLDQPIKNVKDIVATKQEISKPSAVTRPVPILSSDVDNVPTNIKSEMSDALCIVIGIEEHKYAPKVTFANRDATVFYEYAKTAFGIPERNIYLRTNEGATKGEFDKVFGQEGWIARRIKRGETDVVVYYSGHGAPSKNRATYLIPQDIDPNYAETGYPLTQIYENLSKLQAKSITVILDCCFSGADRERQMILADARPVFITVESPLAYKNIVVFSAASGNEISSIYPEMKHGLFTYYFLKGLQGDSDVNRDKKLTIGELFEYTKNKVKIKAGELDREQTPTLLSDEQNQNRILVRYE